jgi:hypothetical protein
LFGISLRDYNKGNINISIGDKKDGLGKGKTIKLMSPPSIPQKLPPILPQKGWL